MSLFNGGVAFVSGAGSGIGRAVVLQFAADGVTKIAMADISAPRMAETKAIVAAAHAEVELLSIVGDFTKEEDIENAISETVKAFGRVDFACNCAGIAGTFAPIGSLSTESFESVVSINMKGVWLAERALLKQMEKQEPRPFKNGLELSTRGSIVNISSIFGHVGMGTLSPYTMAKHAVLGLVKADAIDYSEKLIRVNAVCPGFCRSNLVDDETWKKLEPVITSTPMKRLGAVEEVATAVAFLASDRASFITGTSLLVDGGYTCH